MRGLLSSFAFVCTLFFAGVCAAAPLVIKDNYRSPRNGERDPRQSTTLIVLHTTEANAKSSLNKLSERGEAHYCVTEAGEVYRIVDRNLKAFHAGRSMWNSKEDCDDYSIGIEVVGYHNKMMPLKQLAALKELLVRLKKLYGIKDSQIVCHSQVAYGAPNKYHKKRHRGRKRCGMLFAMPSVRTKLGLSARVAYDPDVKAKRLVQADAYLQCVLYGSVDTMTAYYGKSRPMSGVRPVLTAGTPAKTTKPVVAARQPAASKTPPVTRKTTSKPVVAARTKPAKPAPKTPPPIVKPPLIVPKQTVAQTEKPERGWMQVLGLKGGFFKKDAKLIVPAESPDSKSTGTEASVDMKAGVVLPLPPNLQIGRMGDDVRDLEALAKLPGYTRGGPVSPSLSPYKIAGAAWRSPSTYYYSPEGRITTGDKINEKSVEAGTFVFYRKK